MIKFLLMNMISLAAVRCQLNLDISILLPFNSQEQIDYINSIQNSWTAGHNQRFQGSSKEDVKKQCGVALPEMDFALPIKIINTTNVTIPETFNSRTQWPKCSSIGSIQDQSDCGSCWAFGSSEAMSDRYCIANNQTVNPIFSAQQLLSCCAECVMTKNNGCEGGYPARAWQYWIDTGLCTGGLYETTDSCQPYLFPPCDHREPGPYAQCTLPLYSLIPICSSSCQAGYPTTFAQDTIKGNQAYQLPMDDVKSIQVDIMTNGPVTASFTIYSDFPFYKTGVYVQTSYESLGGHVVKIIGWGVEGGVDYWLVANSWNKYWGEEGFFKIRRGSDECGIENWVFAGLA